MRILYIDMLCGAAGDMLLASLIDLGFPIKLLEEQLRRLPVEPIELAVEKVVRGGITCTQVTPELDHSHEYRHLEDILALLQRGAVAQSLYEKCERVFDRLATAEAKVHGIPKDHVHFHEIGALDTIVDILGVCMAIEYFKVDEVRFSTLTDGYGTIRTAHGVMPVPVPATAVMIEGYRIRTLQIPTELLTPTGAALLTALGEQLPDTYDGKVVATGYGCGSKVFDEHPNFLRAILLEKEQDEIASSSETVLILESDMDHISGEIMGDVAALLLDTGALDVSWLPLYMKKGRPGYRLSVMADERDGQAMIDTIIRHTRTLGVRLQRVGRVTAQRRASKTTIAGAECDEKQCAYKGYTFSRPEYESLAALARKKGCSVMDLMEEYLRGTTQDL
ncbi:MAG: nickel pincer cofactor biosynthesis protein LarC [Chitinispirillaceae bacterium]|nr:nickel pincer cofactor biosynthesis protein LarC [Chitinispirillaceae bacterium]